MTEDEARTRAQELWGKDTPANGQPAKAYGDVLDDGTQFGRRYKVGRRVRDTHAVNHFEALGEAASWSAAFDEAKRRGALQPRQ